MSRVHACTDPELVLYAPGVVWKNSGPLLQRGLGRRRNEEKPGRKGLIRREKEPEGGKIKRICQDQNCSC